MSKIPSDHWLHHLPGGHVLTIADIEFGDTEQLAALHRRWAALVDERGALYAEIDERRVAGKLRSPEVECYGRYCGSNEEIDETLAEAAGWPKWRIDPGKPPDFEAQRDELKAALAAKLRAWEAGIEAHGIAPLIARVGAVEEELDATLDEISAQPVGSFADVAVLLDVFHECEGDDGLSEEEVREDSRWDVHLCRRVAALAPGFVFTSFRRYNPGLAYDAHGIPTAPAEGAAAEPSPLAAGIAPAPVPLSPADAPAADRGELGRRAAALAAEYRGSLPPGDAGLIEAERRRGELASREKALYREFEPSPEEEEQFIEGIVQPCDNELWDFINETPPEGLAGVAVKLRCLRGDTDSEEGAELGQCLAAIEREITASAPRSIKGAIVEQDGRTVLHGPRLVPIEGNGMEPTLRRGDFVAATPIDRFRCDGLYVIDVSGQPVVYRCQADFRGNVVLRFDNPIFNRPWSMPAEMFDTKVIGIVAAEIRVIDRRLFEGR